MNVEFIKIEMQNFKSVGEKIELSYTDFKGLNFIYGNNMDVPNAKNRITENQSYGLILSFSPCLARL